ncbi:MAG TPA: FtsX-like permease family protein, partial [Thermoanaerobaculia bacterium]
VREAGAATTLPLEIGPTLSFTIEGRYRGIKTEGAANGVAEANYRAVSAHLFKALGVPVKQGRAFTPADRNGSAPVAIVNEAAARRYWPGQSPIGQRITVGQPFVPEMADPAPRTVVGVVGDVREISLDEAPPVIVYVPIGQMTPPLATLFVKLLPMALVVHTAGDPGAVATATKGEIWSVDPQQPVTNLTPMSQIVAKSLGARRFNALLLGLLAVVALVLAAVGIYGVLSYLVGQRTREIGIRMALGASSRDVLRMVLWQGLGAVLVGVGIGLGLALVATYLLKGLLYGVSTTDPLTFCGVPLLLAAVAAVASAVPAFRASRLDPLIALAQK